MGDLERVAEHRVEVVLDRSLRTAVVAALRAAHPYEEPAFHVLEAATDSTRDLTGAAVPNPWLRSGGAERRRCCRAAGR